MHPVKRRAATWLFAALALAVLTPLYVARVAPSEAVYHRNGMVFLMQVIPYAVCAALWLPARHPSAPRFFLRLAIVLFVVACALYGPWLVHPGPGGDMVGLGYILICLVTTGAIVGISLIALVVFWWSARRH
jgi:hypothetical protein